MRSGRLLLRGLAAGLALAAGGCDMVLGIDDLVADRDSDTSSTGGDGCSSTCGSPGCGACPESAGIEVSSTNGNYRIDAFEITNAEYQAWLELGPTTQGQGVDCEWNDTYRPGVLSQAAIDASEAMGGLDDNDCIDASWLEKAIESGYQNAPVTCVDWCDAVAYCRWAGKGLCARIGSGERIEIVDVTDLSGTLYATPDESAWYHACSAAGTRDFPYGPDYDPAKCNDDELRARDVGSYQDCVGGLPDLYDMSGNVAEWEDACTPFDPPVGQNCLVRGGCWYNTLDVDLACDASRALMRGGSGTGIGFRCCGSD